LFAEKTRENLGNWILNHGVWGFFWVSFCFLLFNLKSNYFGAFCFLLFFLCFVDEKMAENYEEFENFSLGCFSIFIA
jgi:hypothetical protein